MNLNFFKSLFSVFGIVNAEKVNHPIHYNNHPSRIEAIELIAHMNFCLGNAVKYLFRCHLKGGHEDINKAIWYLEHQVSLDPIPKTELSKELQSKFEKVISAEQNKSLKPVYRNIMNYHFFGYHASVIWESIQILHKLETDMKEGVIDSIL